MGIDVEKDFKETYEVIEGKEKVLAELKAAAKKADAILLATDPDREGEAIAWHIAEELKRPKLDVQPRRVPRDHEEGRRARRRQPARARRAPLRRAARAPRARPHRRLRRLGARLVEARVRALARAACSRSRSGSSSTASARSRPSSPRSTGTSASRCAGKSGRSRSLARLRSADGEKLEVKDGEHAGRGQGRSRERAATRSRRSRGASRSATRPRRTRRASSSRTRRATCASAPSARCSIAQGLYEGVDLEQGRRPGRSHHVHAYRLDARQRRRHARRCASIIGANYGEDYLPEKPNVFKARRRTRRTRTRRSARRRSSYTPESVRKHLKDEQFKLYKLIWDRFVASQMAPAVYDQTGVDIEAKPQRSKRRATATLRAPRERQRAQVRAAGSSSTARASRRGDGRVDGRRGEGDADGRRGDGERRPATERRRQRQRRRAARSRTRRRLAARARRGRGAHARRRRPACSPSRSSRSRRRATTKARSCASSRSAASAGPARTPRSSARCRRATTSRSSRAGRCRPTDARQVRGRRPGLDRARLHGSELHRQDGGGARRGRGRQARARRRCSTRFYKRFREQLDKCEEAEALEARARADRRQVRRVRRASMLKRWSKNGWFLGCRAYPKCKFTRDLGRGRRGPRRRSRVTDYHLRQVRQADGRSRPVATASSSRAPATRRARTRSPFRSACRARSAAATSSRSARRSAAAAVLRLLELPETSATSSSGRSRSHEPCPLCEHPFLVIAGGKKSPKLVCPTARSAATSARSRSRRPAPGAAPSRRRCRARRRPEIARRRSESALGAAPRSSAVTARSPSSARASPAARPRSSSPSAASRCGSSSRSRMTRTPAQIERSVSRARLLELVARRGAVERRRPAQGRDAAARLARDARRRSRRACRPAARSPSIASASAPSMTRRRRGAPAHRAVVAGVVERIPEERPLVIATGPLTGDALAADLERARRGRARSPTTTRSRRSSAPTRSTGSKVFSAVALRQGRGRRGSRRVRQLPVRRERVPRVRGRGRARREGRAAGVRGRALLRGLPADRGDGRARRAHARVRPDEAGRPHRSAHRALAVRRGAAAPGRRSRHRVQPGRLSDAHDVGPSRSASSARSRASRRRSSSASAPCTATRSSTRRAARPDLCSSRRSPASTSPGRSRASRATSRARRAACSARSSSPNGLRGASRSCRRRRPRSAASSRTCARNPERLPAVEHHLFAHPALGGTAAEEARQVRGDGRARAVGSRSVAQRATVGGVIRHCTGWMGSAAARRPIRSGGSVNGEVDGVPPLRGGPSVQGLPGPRVRRR